MTRRRGGHPGGPPRGRDDGGPRAPRDRGFEPAPRARGAGERVVFGVGPVRELVARRPRAITQIWIDPRRADRSAGDPVAQIAGAARAAGVAVHDRERDALDHAAGEGARHQGVVAWLGPFAYAELDAMLAAAPPGPALVVALDGVEDPRNLGAILRSAYLLGAAGVIIPEHRAAQVTATVAKTSAGASELIAIAQVGNLVRALDELRDHGLWRVAVHATAEARPIHTIDLTSPVCLVLGAEGTGVRPLVARSCDFHAVIPMVGAGVGSFNVSVAAALALYEVQRQRAAGGP